MKRVTRRIGGTSIERGRHGVPMKRRRRQCETLIPWQKDDERKSDCER